MKRREYEKLAMYREAHRLVLEIMRVSESLPKESYADLVSQIIESALFISRDIALGHEARELEEYFRRMKAARSQTFKMATLLPLAKDLGVLHETWCARWEEAYEKIRDQLDDLVDKFHQQAEDVSLN